MKENQPGSGFGKAYYKMKTQPLPIFYRTSFILTLFLLFVSFNANSQEYKIVKAQKGDGIYSLLRRHGLSPKEFNAFVTINKDKLGKKNELVAGRSYKLPVPGAGNKAKTAVPAGAADTGKAVTAPQNHNQNNAAGGNPASKKEDVVVYKILGTKYERVTIIDHQLKGAVYYLQSGHGGPDPGAIGKLKNHILCEDEYAYDVTLRLARELIEHDATVFMITRDPNDGIRDESFLTPDKDEVCYPNLKIPLRQIDRLLQRKDAVNSLYMKYKNSFQRQVVIHVDSRSRRENIDVFFYYDQRSSTGKKLANTLRETFDSKYRQYQPGRGYQGSVSERNLYVIKNSYPPAVFIELGNINHTRDQKRFIIVDNRQAVANWLCEGLIKDFHDNK